MTCEVIAAGVAGGSLTDIAAAGSGLCAGSRGAASGLFGSVVFESPRKVT
jgi:hypothetical protein